MSGGVLLARDPSERRQPWPNRDRGDRRLGSALDDLAAVAPAGRPASAEEIASAMVYLARDEASFIQGVVLAVDGGRSAA